MKAFFIGISEKLFLLKKISDKLINIVTIVTIMEQADDSKQF